MLGAGKDFMSETKLKQSIIHGVEGLHEFHGFLLGG
jgi:hypothetical protein